MLINNKYFFSFVFLITTIHVFGQDTNFKELVLNKPFRALWKLSSYHYTQLHKMTDEQKKHPFGFITECFDVRCPLIRDFKEGPREKFEKFCVEKMPKDLSLVSFGSGFLFSELVLLTLFLKKHTTKNISLDCIDPIYCFMQNNPEKKNNNPYQENFFQLSTENRRFVLHKLPANFKKFFSQYYPETNLTLNFHTNVKNFLNQIVQQKRSINFIISADTIKPCISDKSYRKNLIYKDYLQLCTQAQKLNPSCQNYHLEGEKNGMKCKKCIGRLNPGESDPVEKIMDLSQRKTQKTLQ